MICVFCELREGSHTQVMLSWVHKDTLKAMRTNVVPICNWCLEKTGYILTDPSWNQLKRLVEEDMQ